MLVTGPDELRPAANTTCSDIRPEWCNSDKAPVASTWAHSRSGCVFPKEICGSVARSGVRDLEVFDVQHRAPDRRAA